MVSSLDWAAPFLGLAGISLAMILAAFGSCYGICKSGVGIASSCVYNPQLLMKSLMPVIMAGILGVYGLVVGILINSNLPTDGSYSFYNSCLHFASGLCVGSGSLAAGYAIGNIGHAGSYTFVQNPSFFITLVLMLIFSEVLGLYGLISAIVLITKSSN